MGVESTPYSSLLQDAEAGYLQLPEFQRSWKWGTRNVIELFDSVRKGFPIGSFLFMDRNDEVPITPRPFFATTVHEISPDPAARFVLDGQQRLTAGLILFYGRGQRRYYINLDFLYRRFSEHHSAALAAINSGDLSVETALARSAFLSELDAEDEYCTARPQSNNPATLLIRSHLLDVTLLRPRRDELDIELSRYKRTFPERGAFIDFVVKEQFALKESLIVPVTVVDKNQPIEAICRIFATLNTTGKPLTPFELVVSLLYPHGIRLRDDLIALQERSTYYRHMDSSGEVLLQTIALLDGQDPKKARLPKTVDHHRYRNNRDRAYAVLESLGEFLSARLGLGLNRTSTLIAYDSVFAPMAVALEEVRDKLSGQAKIDAEHCLERWYVLAALDRRYQEGIHNKQLEDPRAFRSWAIEGGDPPAWIHNFRTPSLRADSGSGARPALIKSLINRNAPNDLLSGDPVGYREHAQSTEVHHFFPVAYCRDTLRTAKSDYALNLLFTSIETNGQWSLSNPHDQIKQAIVSRGEQFVRTELEKQFVGEEALEILMRPSKTAKDFEEFLIFRERRILTELAQWGATGASGDVDDLAEDET